MNICEIIFKMAIHQYFFVCIPLAKATPFPGLKTTITGGENVEDHHSIRDVWKQVLVAEMGKVQVFMLNVIGRVRVNP